MSDDAITGGPATLAYVKALERRVDILEQHLEELAFLTARLAELVVLPGSPPPRADSGQ